MDDKEPEVFIVTEYTCLINYELDDPRRNLFSQDEINLLISQGYKVVTYREWWDYSDKKFEKDQRRIHRTIQQRLKRQLKPKTKNPKKPNH